MTSGRGTVGVLAAAALSAGVITLVAGALWMLGSASGERAKLSSLQIAPKDADIFVAINTDPTSPQWLAVNDSLTAINAKDPIRRAIDEALADVNLEWERDILPVAGDEAFFSVPDVSEASQTSGYVAGFLLRDSAKAQEVFDSLRERAEAEGQEHETEEYEGVTIYYTVAPDIDGDPATQSECRHDDDGTILCDGQPPIAQDPSFECFVIGAELLSEGRSTSDGPEECQTFFQCPTYFPDGEANTDDIDNDGTPDSCEQADEIQRDWELGVELGSRYQDCADLADLSDAQCQDLTNFGGEGAVALFKDVLAVGASPDDVKGVIDVVQLRAPSAEENQRLQEFREGQKEEFLMWGYADLAPVWDLAEAAIPAGLDLQSGPDPFDPGSFGTSEDSGSSFGEGEFRVTSFHADYTIDSSGWLDVKETIEVDFGLGGSPPIARSLPALISYDSTNDEVVRSDNFVVTQDGLPGSFTGELLGDTFEVSIGDPSEILTGPHTYEFQYTVQGGVRQSRWGDNDPYYELRWAPTGDSWSVPIEGASVTIDTPHGEIDAASCHVGVGEFGADEWAPCQATFDAHAARFVSDGPIEPGASLHISIGVNGESGRRPEIVPSDGPSEEEFPIAGDSQQELPFATEELMTELRGAYDRVGFSVSATGDGFALDLTVLHAADYEPQYLAIPAAEFDSHFADNVPADTMFFFAGYDIYGQNWLPARDHLKDMEFTGGSVLDDYLEQFKTETGLNLEEDILSLLTGEYAVGGNVSDFDQETPDFSILAMMDVADAGRAQASLDELGEYLESQNVAEVDRTDAVQRWALPESAEAVGITVSGDSLIAGYPDTAVDDAVKGFDDALSATDDWKRAMDILPAETTSVGFVSVSRILEELRRLPDAESSFEAATNGEITLDDLTPIRSVGFGTTSRENGFGFHFALFMEDR